MKKRITILCAFALLVGTQLNARDWFVKPSASTSTAGDSWETACNISVITGANPAGIADGDVVHLAAGTYESSTSKTLTKYISIFGGYSATSTGTDLTLRDLVANTTIFAPSAGGTARCLTINATAAPTVAGQKIVLDGLTFNGFTMASPNSGVAITLTTAQSAVDFKNVNFINNVSVNAVGGAFVMASFAYNVAITFDGCTFTGNQANWTSGTNSFGGAMYFNNGATAKTINIKNSTFKNNTAYGRGGAGYFGTNMTVNISDCTFDSNYCTNTADNVTSGGCFYITGGSSLSSTFNVTRSIFVNSSCTAKGSVFWFNTTPMNYLNMTDCSLIGNYAKRISSARAAIDADNYTTNFQFTLNGCVLSNYNYGGSPAGKQSNKADVMVVANTPTILNSTSSTFANSILNGVYFTSSNTLDATSPSVLYGTTSYLKDSTINLALSGDLKITDKIVFKKTFTEAEVGLYVHTQIFDVKRNTGKAMTLIATFPEGYSMNVDNNTDYVTSSATINIPASATDPVIIFRNPLTTKLALASRNSIKSYSSNGVLHLSNVELGSKVSLYTVGGQLLSSSVATSATLAIPAKGFVVVKVNSTKKSEVLKAFVK